MLNRSRALASVAMVALVFGAGVVPAAADTLQEAIGLAYRTNPTLQAQRANQRALDETSVQARAGLRPTVGVSVGANYSRTESDRVTMPGQSLPLDTNGDGIADATVTLPGSTSGGTVETDSANASINLSQNIWTAGRTARAIDSAEAQILSGRENLRSIEQQVMQSVIQAYADVVRDLEILRIRQENLVVLRRQLDESNARFEVGEITRTDVAQSEARLAQSEADLSSAQAQLSVSRAAYAAVVGQSPTEMSALPILPGLPTDFDAALDIALAENPRLRAANYDLTAAEANVAAARAEYLPSARLQASYGGTANDFSASFGDRTAFTAGATVSVPLFTGGLNRSRVAQALERANAAQINIEGERRTVLQSVSAAYAQVLSSQSTLRANDEAVRAATVAAEGVRQEAQVGLRTTLDVLNQELELRAAQVARASSLRNQYVAQAQLLAAMGRLGGPNLDPTLEVYDPAENYNAVRVRGALPWDAVIETIDRVASPVILPAQDTPDAPIDAQLKSGVVRTAPVY